MSKNTAKQRYTQLMEWLETLPKKKQVKQKEQSSRMSYYKAKGYGR